MTGLATTTPTGTGVPATPAMRAPLSWAMDEHGLDWQALSQLYAIAPLGHKPADTLRTCFAGSRYKCFVYDAGHLVGAGRALADGVDCACICDVAVHPAYQGRGLGRAIIEKLKALAHGHRKVILYANPGTEDFYRRLGFARMCTAMAIFADQERAVRSGLVELRSVPADPRGSDA